ncbi:paladin [Brachyhypopomus gauderio]|uniref:paladin n=1 Tax=Brachyhypopomus gauderio TaxID=698409 RepID=UPI00404184F7
MGTTASAAPPTAPESFQSNGMMDSRQSLSSTSFQAVSIHNSKAKSIITNKVAPVVITYNCRQEFQIHDDLPRTHYKVGRISDTMPEHFLVQGSYFMVQDVFSKADVLNTTNSCGAPNFRQSKGSYPVFGMGQPSLAGFKQVLQKLQSQGNEEVIFFCVREEPLLFLHLEDDFVPYTPRRQENLHEQLHGLSREPSVENLELSMRRELHDFARLNENVFYVYNDIEHFKDEPHKISISSEEDIHVTEEVYKRPLFTMPAYRYHRIPLPLEGAPMEEQLDAFVSVLRESPSLSLNRDVSRPLPVLLFSCHVGVGRTNVGMILGTLVMQRLEGAPPPPPQSPPPSSPTESPVTEAVVSEQKVQFQVIKMLIDKLPKGQQVMQEVDRAIELCSEVHDIKDAIYENKKNLEAIGEDYHTQGNSSKAYFLQRALQGLERYIYLILFNAYLHEQYPLAFARNFSQWMCANAWIYRLLACTNQSELRAPPDLVTKGARVLVSDEYMAPDVLSTMKEMKVANFRRVPKMPVYGMAQPTSEAVAVVLAYLKDERRRHERVVWVNLREELVLEAEGQVFSPREPSHLEQPVSLYAAHTQDIENLETALKEELLSAQKWLEVTLEQGSQVKLFKSCQTLQDVFTQQQLSHPGLHYHRIPLPDRAAPRETDFDRLLEAMKSVLAEDSQAAFVFNCANGKGSTTTAMTIAALTRWHYSGFPEFGEEEIVSVPDAKYTKGEFEVVMQLVRRLPDGHQMKREVDMALDSVSETMTPMHYHLREIIISTYRQIKSSKTEQERHALLLRSLQYLERYIYLILFNTYLHLEKASSWSRSFTAWMQEVAARAGVYDLLDQLGFSEFENLKDSTLARLRVRWQDRSSTWAPFRGELI